MGLNRPSNQNREPPQLTPANQLASDQALLETRRVTRTEWF